MPQQMETGLQKARRLIKESDRRNEIFCELFSQNNTGEAFISGETVGEYFNRRMAEEQSVSH